jgi:hypothetical protein
MLGFFLRTIEAGKLQRAFSFIIMKKPFYSIYYDIPLFHMVFVACVSRLLIISRSRATLTCAKLLNQAKEYMPDKTKYILLFTI